MKKLLMSLGIVSMLAVFVQYSALAATKGDLPPKARNGAVQIATASPTKVFTGLSGRNAFNIYNNGPNTLWCGFVSNVTNTTGYPVAAGASLGIDMAYHDIGDQDFYCIADTALQVSPADTRWIQVK